MAEAATRPVGCDIGLIPRYMIFDAWGLVRRELEGEETTGTR